MVSPDIHHGYADAQKRTLRGILARGLASKQKLDACDTARGQIIDSAAREHAREAVLAKPGAGLNVEKLERRAEACPLKSMEKEHTSSQVSSETLFHTLLCEVKTVFRRLISPHITSSCVYYQARPPQNVNPVNWLNRLVQG